MEWCPRANGENVLDKISGKLWRNARVSCYIWTMEQQEAKVDILNIHSNSNSSECTFGVHRACQRLYEMQWKLTNLRMNQIRQQTQKSHFFRHIFQISFKNFKRPASKTLSRNRNEKRRRIKNASHSHSVCASRVRGCCFSNSFGKFTSSYCFGVSRKSKTRTNNIQRTAKMFAHKRWLAFTIITNNHKTHQDDMPLFSPGTYDESQKGYTSFMQISVCVSI